MCSLLRLRLLDQQFQEGKATIEERKRKMKRKRNEKQTQNIQGRKMGNKTTGGEEKAEGGGGRDFIDELPPELLSLIISFVPTPSLFPCLRVCKSFLRAALDEISWQTRCLLELQITEQCPDCNWYQTYRGTPILLLDLHSPFLIPLPPCITTLTLSKRWPPLHGTTPVALAPQTGK